MRKTIITSALLALLISFTGASILTAEDIFDRISAEAIHEEGDEIYHSAFLYLHADKTLDLENEDAVILFQRFETCWTVDGRLVQTTKRSVLIRTEYGLDHFADLRIPWDGDHQKLTVHTLRTLRIDDDEPIDAGPTAVVETLPFAVDRAPDYCHLRETMLLHDGVELPCVLETVWTVEDTEPFRPGASGTHSFMGPEPALVSQFVLMMPVGMEPIIRTADGAPQPTECTDAAGHRTLTVEMADLGPRPHPATDESIRLQPRVSWSTWKDWSALDGELTAQLEKSAVLDDALKAAFEEKLEKARTPSEKAWLVAEFVDQTTRLVGYGSNWWPTPRPATRTWATGYGHRVDRAVLAAALYGEAGFTARPVFRSEGLGKADTSVPGLGWSEGVSLMVTGTGVEGWFDPASARFTSVHQALAGRTYWITGEDYSLIYREPDGLDRMAIRFDLAFDAEKQAWTGTGVLDTEGTLSPFHRMSGLGTEAMDYLSGFAGSLLGSATVTAFNPERFAPSGVTVGFALEVPAGDRDALDRLSFEPASFPVDHFVTLHQETRESDIHFPAPLVMEFELHLEPGDLETEYLPSATRRENGAGLWQVEVKEEEDEVVLVRRLELPRNHYPAAQWPDLRALLLANENRAGRLLYFK